MNIKQFWKAVLAQDEEEIRKYFHKDAYVNWHCTNEHFTVDEYIIANCEYPGEWDGIIERTEIVNELIITVTQISPHYDSRRRTNYAQKGLYFSHVEHWYWIPSADRREDADRQIFQPVVTVTQSELRNQRVTVINKNI